MAGLTANTAPHTVVIGGGVAGIAAAVALTVAGHRVTLVERRGQLGGRASSYRPPSTPGWVDNSPHVLLGCCTSLRWLYAQLDLSSAVTWHSRLPLAAADGTRGTFASWSALPPPAHLAPGLFNLPGLSPRDRLVLGAACAKMAATPRPWPDDRTFAQWLGPLTTPTLDRSFWRLMLRSVLNADADEVSARYGLLFFVDGLLAHREAYVLGVPGRPLHDLHHRAPLAWLRAHGQTVLLGRRATLGRATRGFVVQTDRAELSADSVVLAVGPRQATLVLSPVLRQLLGDSSAVALDHRPIVGVHLGFDRPTGLPAALGLLGGDVDWVFGHEEGRRASVVISRADQWHGLSPAAMAERAWQALRSIDPELPRPVWSAACREAQATFVPAPGLDGRRPPAQTAVDGLALAGAWTATGWPATMEGACRSGLAAAGLLAGRDLSVPDLPRQGLFGLTT